jgi:Na+/H+ antiporter NhaD/arsenite permease-like protein
MNVLPDFGALLPHLPHLPHLPPGLDAGRLLVLAVFGIVYLGMILGGLPRLQLDRTGVALLGAIAIVGSGLLSPEEAARAIHLPTILLLFSFMVISAQLRLGGFYTWLTRGITGLGLGPAALLALVVAAAGALSAVFSNDIVCLAMAPVLADACLRRRLDPLPFLLALACASNIGSAATLIGNPQNMLIGQTLRMDFAGYLRDAIVPVALGLVALWVWLAWRGGLVADGAPADAAERARPLATSEDEYPPFDRWQAAKGLTVAALLLVAFLASPWPHEVVALLGAGVLLLSRRFHSSKVMGLVDWELLILFVGLFVVNHALERSGLTREAVAWLAAQGLQLRETGTLAATTLLLSNLVSNVPAVMLLLPVAAEAPEGGLTLALVSTLAGNLFIVGSVANIIVVDAARRRGVSIDWKRHLSTGLPVTLATLAITAGWLALRT